MNKNIKELRKILYRAKALNEKFSRGINAGDWVEGEPHVVATTNPYIHIDVACSVSIDPNTLGQFTGKYDCTGKRIFEDDIFTVRGKYPKIIKFSERHAGFVIANIHDLQNSQWMDIWQQPNPQWWRDHHDCIRVVGNIHDNPDMVNKADFPFEQLHEPEVNGPKLTAVHFDEVKLSDTQWKQISHHMKHLQKRMVDKILYRKLRK